MQIATARTNAERFLSTHLIKSRAKRPPKDAAVMVRYPTKDGVLITAPDQETLKEKLAKRMQYHARRNH